MRAGISKRASSVVSERCCLYLPQTPKPNTTLTMPKIIAQMFPLLFFLLLLSSSAQIHPSDLATLRLIKNSLTDLPSPAASPRFFSSWNFSPASDPCSSFAGLTCSSSRVAILSLGTGLSDSPGLAGTLSPALARLTGLTQLILFPGIVTGPIPPQLASLQSLKVLALTGNRLTGEIPAAIFRLPNLHTLDLSRNQLSGKIPPAIDALAQVKVLVLASNKLSGEIPRLLPENLLHLDLGSNSFSGTLPPRLPAALRYLAAGSNLLWGEIDGMESLTDLAYLDLSANKLSGPIPGALIRPELTSIYLQRNNLSGRVPQSPPWPDAVAGSTVDLSHNTLTGELTTALAAAESVFLNNNLLSGGVPDAYVAGVERGTIKTLYLQHNYITGFPMEPGSALPDTAAVCVSYNCIDAPPLGMEACPASAGDQISRPAYQCSKFHN